MRQRPEDYPICMNAEDVQEVLGVSRAGAYTVMHSADFPLVKLGKRMLVPRDEFFDWLERQINKKTG